MSSVVPQHRGPWRFEELADLPDDGRRYEVVDGALVVTPPPSHLHQAVGAALLLQLESCRPPDWRVYYAWGLPMGTDGRTPDLAVVRADVSLRSAAPYPVGPAAVGMVVEVVSPSSRKTDRFAKPGEYAEVGIPLFWRVETEPELVVHAFVLRDGAYVEHAVTSAGPLPVPWGEVTVDLTSL